MHNLLIKPLSPYTGLEVSKLVYKHSHIIGDKKIDTKTRYAMNGKATFNERFAMKTILNYDPIKDEFEPKPVSINHLFNKVYSHYSKYTEVSRQIPQFK